jgi:phage shock protein A
MTGAGDEIADIDQTIERAEERTRDMEARSAALDELRESGALEGAAGVDELDRELEQLARDATVESELETIKHEVDGGSAQARERAPDAETVEPPTVDQDDVENELEELKEKADQAEE